MRGLLRITVTVVMGIFFFFLEAGAHRVDQSGLKQIFTCLGIPNAEIKGVHSQARLTSPGVWTTWRPKPEE